MASYLPAKITAAGQALMAKELAGEGSINFTRMALGSGTYTTEEYAGLSSRSALKAEQQDIAINSKAISNSTSLILESVFNNEELNAGYRMSEVGIFAEDTEDENSSEILYAIAITEPNCADYIPPYNGVSLTRIREVFQIDVVDATTATVTLVDSVVVTMTYLEAMYYDKDSVDTLLAKKMNYELFGSLSSLSALNSLVELPRYVNGNYTLLVPVASSAASGSVMVELGIETAETAIMIFRAGYVFLHFPYNNKVFRYSDSATNNWVRVYADVNPSEKHPPAQHAHFNNTLANTATTRGYILDNQREEGRLYISGTDFIEFVDLESTSNAEVLDMIDTSHGSGVDVTMLSEPSGTYYIQTWHKAEGEIVRRFKVGTNGTYSAWVSTTPAAT